MKANSNNTNTNATVATNAAAAKTETKAKAKTDTKAPMISCLNLLKAGIIAVHNDNNVRAMSMEDCEGITEQAFNQWCSYVKELRNVTIPYVELTMKKDAEKAAVTRARGKVFSAWKDVLNDALAKDFSRNWFVREDDTAWLLRAVVRNARTANGSMYAFRGETEFRREVERLIGCRIASNAILSDEDAAVIRNYENAIRTEKKCNDRLNTGSKTKASLTAQLDAANKKLEEKTKEFSEMDALLEHPELREILISGYEKEVREIKDAIKSTKKSLSEALTTKAELGTRYKLIMDKVAKIEA